MRKILLGLAAITTAITLSACNDSAASNEDQSDQVEQGEQQDGNDSELPCDDDEEKEEEKEDAGACSLDPEDLPGADTDSDS